MQRRTFTASLLAGCAPLLSSLAHAQGQWPTKPIKFIVP